ncbi:rhodanese-like domain-containing protein [Lutibacter sp. B1]|uniref:rhodanese-like domain-containing protein n=1 Tax=Lutibacter sp. B1 TaxID=2725996 RepID=UPI001456E097|nr:rhodanese-like domain-containing protein [Lutibacter sp. B1]NLP58217.1 rhodanese-like domain-containing protein [Lutibacter sp. B1]
MKELEKTKRLSIAAVISILVVLIGLLTFKRPKIVYNVNAATTIEKITNPDYLISLNNINNPDYILIDVRNKFEFDRGHLENAINIDASEILEDENLKIFNELKKDNKTVLLYGKNPNEAIPPYMLLYQLGFDNLKILTVENSYQQNKLVTKNIEIEKSVADINAFIQESIKKAEVQPKPQPKVVSTPKKIVPVKKKKKMPVEGGC